jgi:starch synthase
MRILMVTSECVPLAKAGGLADMVPALGSELIRQGHDVRVVMPRYYSVDRDELKPVPDPLGVPMGPVEAWCGIYQTTIGEEPLPVFLMDHEGLYGRDGIYGSKEEPDFGDNVARFSLLSRGALQLCRRHHWYPDVVHAHDWPSALVPVYLQTVERSGPFAETASVLTVHNLGYQGAYPSDLFPLTGLSWQAYHGSGFESFGRLNLLKAGIHNADVLTTVSPTYAGEIQTPEMGHGLDALLRHRSPDLFGVLNGIDYQVWNPETDPLIAANYSHEDFSGKQENRAALRREFGLGDDPDRPILGMVTRLVDQKGISELCAPGGGSLFSICADLELDVVILGTGEAWCEAELTSLAQRVPNLRVELAFDNRLAHLIEAGSDLFLMPSRYEPCGLNQMYSLRYGTLPIVRRTGGLADTVSSYRMETGEGTGFVFDDLAPRAIHDTVGWAVWTWYNRPDHFRAMQIRAMRERFSWTRSAERYAELYQWALDRRSGSTPRVW